ncbi:MAG: DNA polymerase I [Oscillospiraceae bacterium]|nr:DNA polymerase I [Oscillospiraceae bacterium]
MRVLVVDGNSIANRAFYGIKLLSNKQGQFTNAIYGFMNILIRLSQECEPDAVAVAFDLKAPTFRHQMYQDYKAGRKPMPPELRSQMPILKELLTDLGYRIVEKEGYEADDILGTLSAQCTGENRCFLATGDRDSLQLVSENTSVLLASTKMGKPATVLYDVEKIKEVYGVSPQGMIEIKALMGDTSDNIPGVAGIGEKTAGKLIQDYGSIDYIYEHIDELDIKKGVREKLIAGKDSAYLSRDLGRICLEAPIDTDLASYRIRKPDSFKAIKLLANLEMFGIIEKLGLTAETAPEETQAAAAEAIVCREERDLCALLGEMKNAGESYFLTEFSGEEISKIYFFTEKTVKCVHRDCLDFDSFLRQFCGGEWKKYTADSKELYKYILKREISFCNLVMDTTLAGYILNPSSKSYDIHRLCDEYAVALPTVESDDDDSDFAVNCAALPGLCAALLSVIEENGQRELLCDIELPLAEVLASMENIGFSVDRKGIDSFGETMGKEVERLKEKIFAQTGFEFNLNSPKQLGEALFEKMGIPAKKKTKSGYSTNAEVLEELAEDYPVVADILEYRAISKLKSTYCEGLLKVIDADGRIRSTLNQTETRTGRISSAEPNLQNIPVRSPLGREMRRFFVAGEGNVLVDADYSQIELRVLADLAQDSTMISAFNKGEDIHAITASQVFDMPLHMVTPLMRSRAKAVNFGIVYGIGAFSLAKDIGVTRREADDYIKGYLHHYSGIEKYLEKSVESAKEKGYAQTVFARRRYLPELTASNKMLRSFGERVAKNMPVQGTAADIIKIAMIRVYRRLKEENLRARLIMQVHDELIVECPEQERERAEQILQQEMENACQMSVRLSADVHSGKTWYDAKG